jgi:hypothetical protein
MGGYMKKVLAITAVLVQIVLGVNVAPSFSHPGEIPLDSVPIFICFGWDDNVYYDGLHWADTLFASRKNPDESPILSTYYVSTHPTITNDSLWEEINALYLQGNEIGNHTQTHDGAAMLANMGNKEFWSGEIGGANDDLNRQSGIPLDAITGFRTPFLTYSTATFEAMQENNIEYDCSIEHFATQYQNNDGEYETGLVWPYTLDNGKHSSSYGEASVEVPGMWELPVHEFQPATGWNGVTGYDWNLWFKGYDKQGVIDLWKSSLQVRVEGDPVRGMVANRVPFFIGTHTDFYTDDNTANSTASDNTVNRRAAIAEFIDWALEYSPAVRIVPQRAVIQWMKNPVPYTQFSYDTGLLKNLPPIGTSISNKKIAEESGDSYTVGTLTTTSNVNDDFTSHTYSIIGESHGFKISGSELQTAKNFDFETVADRGPFKVKIRSTDNGTPALSDDSDFAISIDTLNDNSPTQIDTTVTIVFGKATVIKIPTPTDIDFPSSTVALDSTVSTGGVLGVTVLAQFGVVEYWGEGSYSYTPNMATLETVDEFTYQLLDSTNYDAVNVWRVTAKIKLDIDQSSKDNPIARDDNLSLGEGGSTTINVMADNGFGIDTTGQSGDAITGVELVDAPTFGTAVLLPDGTLTYTHNDSENFEDLVRYKVIDAEGRTGEGVVYITINPLNDNLATISNEVVTVLEDSTISVTVISAEEKISDVDIDTKLKVTAIVKDGSLGSVVITDSSIIYTQNGDIISGGIIDTVVVSISDAVIYDTQTINLLNDTIFITTTPKDAINYNDLGPNSFLYKIKEGGISGDDFAEISAQWNNSMKGKRSNLGELAPYTGIRPDINVEGDTLFDYKDLSSYAALCFYYLENSEAPEVGRVTRSAGSLEINAVESGGRVKLEFSTSEVKDLLACSFRVVGDLSQKSIDDGDFYSEGAELFSFVDKKDGDITTYLTRLSNDKLAVSGSGDIAEIEFVRNSKEEETLLVEYELINSNSKVIEKGVRSVRLNPVKGKTKIELLVAPNPSKSVIFGEAVQFGVQQVDGGFTLFLHSENQLDGVYLVELTVFDVTGNVVVTKSGAVNGNSPTIFWNGCNSNGRAVGAGSYRAVVKYSGGGVSGVEAVTLGVRE